ncbi:hypothetical protein AJ80_09117 [Polytolypa hystricis UAMH7299]|uniref:Uncharacterized protein n=1 Tax=Polytolypa hystricis (strain UAMH7299) TaxID=1447883 RepID=A0A2B7WW09_POLH7|nr:hypothetical protein AJ80_09117 [Polytolypa hystricis UAMH7299]
MADSLRKSFKQVDLNTWLIGDLILRHSNCHSDAATWNDDRDNSSYTLTDAPTPRPPATPLRPNDPHIALVYDASDSSAVWAIGAFCKLKLVVNGTTPEATTLKFVRNKQPNFKTPEILHQIEGDGRSYLFLRRVPGRTLMDAWPSLNEN